jgi:hypothetical protein
LSAAVCSFDVPAHVQEPEDLTQQLGALQVALVSTGDDVATAQQDTAFISDVDIDDVSAVSVTATSGGSLALQALHCSCICAGHTT